MTSKIACSLFLESKLHNSLKIKYSWNSSYKTNNESFDCRAEDLMKTFLSLANCGRFMTIFMFIHTQFEKGEGTRRHHSSNSHNFLICTQCANEWKLCFLKTRDGVLLSRFYRMTMCQSHTQTQVRRNVNKEPEIRNPLSLQSHFRYLIQP